MSRISRASLRTAVAVVLVSTAVTFAPAVAEPPRLPFSEARRAGELLFLSGQVGNRPGTLELVPGGIGPETRQALENIEGILARHGASMADVVKCTVMLDEIGEWSAMNEVYVTFFAEPLPARSALGADGLAIGARVEIECIAHLGGRTTGVEAPAEASTPAADPPPDPGRV